MTSRRDSADQDPTRQRRWLLTLRSRPEIVTVPATLVFVVVLWEVIINAFEVPAYLMPAPSGIGRAVIAFGSDPRFWNNFLVTTREAAIGLGVAVAAAMILAVAVTSISIIRRTLMPYIVASNAIPTLPLAPIIIVWFGFGETSKVVVAAIVAFFPVFVNIVDGLDSADSDLLDMTRVFGGKRRHLFTAVRLRSALPSFFSGLSVSAVFALLGAVVAEWIGASAGLGYLLLSLNFNFRITDMFAVIFYIAVLGLMVYGIVRFTRNKVVFWERLGKQSK